MDISERLSETPPLQTSPQRRITLDWNTAGIRTKILLPLLILMSLSLLGNTIGFIISTDTTRDSILDSQLREDARRVTNALALLESDVRESARRLATDPQVIDALMFEQVHAQTSRALEMDSRAVPVRERFHLDQILLLNASGQTRINIAPSSLERFSFHVRDMMPCAPGADVALLEAPLYGAEASTLPLLVGCATIQPPQSPQPPPATAHETTDTLENLGTVYTVLDVEETLRRIRRESGLASHVHLTSQVPEASPRSAPGKRLVREYESAPLSQKGFRVHSVPIEVGGDTTYITLLLDEQDINQIVNSGFWVMTIGSLITLLVVLIAGYVLSRSFTRPILYLADVAQAVAAGDLSRRSHLPQQDEIGQLGRSLDHATDTITDLLEKQSILLDRQARMAGELQAILNSMGDGVLAVDVEERIVTINPTAATLLRQDVWHISGQQLDTLIATDEPLLAAGLHQIVEQIRSELADPVHPTTEERVSLGTRIVRIQSAPILAGGSILTGAVVLIQDITSAVEAERAKSEFIATASHELRTPLSGLKGFVDIFFLGGTDNLNESQHTFLTTIKRQTDNLVQMVNDLLEIARLEQGRVCAERRWVPIDRAIEESVTSLTTLIEKRQVGLYVDVEPHLPCIWIDVLHLRRILTNILSNAVKYVHHGGTVQVRAYEVNELPHLSGLTSDQEWQHAEQRSVIVEIEDNGVGIRESDQPAIFSRFFRSENDLSVEVGGTGLGLAITKELVRTNQGQIGFRSVEGEGSCFWVRLPAPSTEPLQSNTSNPPPH